MHETDCYVELPLHSDMTRGDFFFPEGGGGWRLIDGGVTALSEKLTASLTASK